jgi:hypothetical protein
MTRQNGTHRGGGARGDALTGVDRPTLLDVAARGTAVLDRCRSELQSIGHGHPEPSMDAGSHGASESPMDDPGPEIAWIRAEAKRARKRARVVADAPESCAGALRTVARGDSSAANAPESPFEHE